MGGAFQARASYDVATAKVPQFGKLGRFRALPTTGPIADSSLPPSPPSHSTPAEPVTTPNVHSAVADPLAAFDHVVNAFEAQGIIIEPKFGRHDGMRTVSLVNEETGECLVSSIGTTTAEAMQRALAAIRGTLAKHVEIAALDAETAIRRLTLLQTAHEVVRLITAM